MCGLRERKPNPQDLVNQEVLASEPVARYPGLRYLPLVVLCSTPYLKHTPNSQDLVVLVNQLLARCPGHTPVLTHTC